MNKSPYELDFEQYIRDVPPTKKEKSENWSIAIGLQQVDGLTPSPYLYEVAKRNIDGDITIEEVKSLIDSYYENKTDKTELPEGTEEADKVSVRISEILSEKTFSFTQFQLLSIHQRLFSDIFVSVKAGKYRTYNITKKEWCLDGDTVLYANADLIEQTIAYDFESEKKFDYSKVNKDEVVKHITRFVANLWQIHPFGEGNTRTTAVFTIKYLKTLGFDVNNDLFEQNSWYFRNALVRANYSNVYKGIYINEEYLEKFFRNLLLGEDNLLKNRYTHIRYNDYFPKSSEENEKSSEENEKSSEENGKSSEENGKSSEEIEKSSEEIEKSSEEIEKSSEEILSLIKKYPEITAKEISGKLKITSRAVEKQISKLKSHGKLKRIGATKNGSWIVIE